MERKILLGIEQLAEDRETRRIRQVAKNPGAMFLPKRVHGQPAQGALMHDALRFGAIDNLPRFADERRRRQSFPIERFQAPTAPDAFHEDRLEDERLSKLGRGHAAKLAQAARLWFRFWCVGF